MLFKEILLELAMELLVFTEEESLKLLEILPQSTSLGQMRMKDSRLAKRLRISSNYLRLPLLFTVPGVTACHLSIVGVS